MSKISLFGITFFRANFVRTFFRHQKKTSFFDSFFFRQFRVFRHFRLPFWTPFSARGRSFCLSFSSLKIGPSQVRKSSLFHTSKTSFFTIKQVVFSLRAFFANLSNFIDFGVHFGIIFACFSHQFYTFFRHRFLDPLFFAFFRFWAKNRPKRGWSRKRAPPPLFGPGGIPGPTLFFSFFFSRIFGHFWSILGSFWGHFWGVFGTQMHYFLIRMLLT